MNRLTEKREDGFYYDLDECMVSNCSNKLGQLEDLEEELGIDLITLFKALRDGIYEKIENGTYITFNPSQFPIKGNKLKLEYNKKCFSKGNDYFYFKDYGKTWSLTREELEK